MTFKVAKFVSLLVAVGVALASPIDERGPVQTAFMAKGHGGNLRHISIDTWLTAEQYQVLVDNGIPTEQKKALSMANYVPSPFAYPTEFLNEAKIRELFPLINKDVMYQNLDDLSNLFHNRHYQSATGYQSAQWIFEKVSNYTAGLNHVTITKINHSWTQFSIVLRFVGKNATLPTVILGGHQDSLAGGAAARAPGADDNGSGSVTILEVVRLLAQDGFRPEGNVEFHWYAAEEAGLLGARDVANSYKAQGIQVAAMLNYDVVGYTEKQQVIGVITDYTDNALNAWLRGVVDTFASRPWQNSQCGYTCSDHAAWGSAGYPASFLVEAEMQNSSPYMHTTRDTIDTVDFDHLVEFVKVAIAYSIELGNFTNW